MSEAAPQEPTEVVAMPRKRKDVTITEPARTPMVMDETTALVAMIERAAKDPTVDIDRMRQLMAIHAEATARRAHTAFLADFARMQSQLPAATRGGKGHNNKSYARFEDVIAAVRPHLAEFGFSLSFRTVLEDKIIRVIGVLGHKAGHEERTELPLPADTSGSKNIVQAWGSAISYGKRYVALTLLGIATEDDDDGNAAGTGATISDEQAMAIVDMLEAKGSDRKAFCAYFKIATVADLQSKDFDRAISALKKKSAAQ